MHLKLSFRVGVGKGTPLVILHLSFLYLNVNVVLTRWITPTISLTNPVHPTQIKATRIIPHKVISRGGSIREC